ncbi:NrsF family protein [Sphingomonas sp. DT-207]|uniref:NrsF family protein n=1 Tax=Sphingomonas sp. DT-207 TaxID=3396167 RepID=UPI003F1B5286
MSNDALISDLSAGLVAVRRRSVWREAALLVALAAIELALFLGIGSMRLDMGQVIDTPYMIWKLASLAAVAAVSGATAVVSLSPTRSPRPGLLAAICLAAVALVAGVFVEPLVGSSGARHGGLPHAYGPLCALSIIVLSLPMLGMLAVLMRRGASTHPEGTSLAAGFAAGSWGALVFAFCCPSNDPLYVMVWFTAGCVVVGALARWLLLRRFRL